MPEQNSRAYALIYGTGNKAGATYAHYLAEQGFNLILIERDMQPLNTLENGLKEKFGAKGGKGGHIPLIYKIVLNKFD